MRWDNLFDDLAGQLESEVDAEDLDVRAEEERLRLSRLGLRDRLVALAAHSPEVIKCVLTDGQVLSLESFSLGRDWLAGRTVSDLPQAVRCLIPLEALRALLLTQRQIITSLRETEPDDPPSSLSRRLGIGFVLRDLCRRRAAVEIVLLDSVIHGTIDRVGRDHFDLAVHERGSARRENAVSHYRVVPLAQLVFVRL